MHGRTQRKENFRGKFLAEGLAVGEEEKGDGQWLRVRWQYCSIQRYAGGFNMMGR
ncbi:hypothetical protein [Pararhodonellum marinum]|uniref:hypothetical protein n=1 Tax=Pararhodonellum marinum TaxID=2755358 RepID=UPI00188E4BF4|nr:hypothetical protein [Pararhodonellum marinum]